MMARHLDSLSVTIAIGIIMLLGICTVDGVNVYNNVSGCYGTGSNTLTVNCSGYGYLINIQNASFGLDSCSAYSTCCPQGMLCRAPVNSINPSYYVYIQQQCDGYQQCKIAVERTDLPVYCGGSYPYTDFVTVYYYCGQSFTTYRSSSSFSTYKTSFGNYSSTFYSTTTHQAGLSNKQKKLLWGGFGLSFTLFLITMCICCCICCRRRKSSSRQSDRDYETSYVANTRPVPMESLPYSNAPSYYPQQANQSQDFF